MSKLLCFAVLASAVPCTLQAVPVTWYLSGVTFADGGRATGSFVYDAALNTISSINIVTTPGATTNSATSALAGKNYTASVGTAAGQINFVTSIPGVPTASGLIRMGFASNLTDAGGVIAIGGGSFEGPCADTACSNASIFRVTSSGNVVAASSTGNRTWYLNGVTFDDGSQAVGSFDYDASTTTYSRIRIASTGGSTFAAGADYSSSLAASTATSLSVLTAPSPQAGSRSFKATFASALTNTGGTVNLASASSSEGTCNSATCGAFTGVLRNLTAGSVSTIKPTGFTKVVSQIADETNQWQTTLILTNLTDAPAGFNASFFKSDGTAFAVPGIGSAVAAVVPARGTRFLTSTRASSPLAVGWAQIDNAQNFSISTIFARRLTGSTEQQATVVGDPVDSASFSVPFDTTNNAVIGFAVVNPDRNNSVSVLVVGYDESGNIILNDASLTLAPLGHTAFNFDSTHYPALLNKKGLLRVFPLRTGTSTSAPFLGITGLEIKSIGGSNFSFTSLQVTYQ